MIVVCTGCSAKFRVADEKVGPRGAKLRCSKCQTVFTVQREIEVPPASPPPPAAATGPVAAVPIRSTPPPLPRRATTLDARAAFDVDLEPHLGAPPTPADPFALRPPELALRPPAPPADPFASPPAAEAPAPDPFASTAAVGSPVDPYGAPPAAGPSDLDPFQPGESAGPGAREAGPAAGPAAFPAGGGTGGFGSLSLEEVTTPPARRVSRSPVTEPPIPVMAASEDPFAAAAAFDDSLSVLDEGVLATAVPRAGSETGTPGTARSDADAEPPLHLDPFAAAAVAADPLAVDEPPRVPAPPPPTETTAERQVADRSFRIRDVLVSAMALAALLLLSMAILVVWRGGLAPGDALRPSAILGALSARPPDGALVARGVTSGLYERARGAPLLFVRGTVVSTAAAPLEEVRVVVEVVRDGAVLAHGEVPLGAVPGPEALFTVEDGAGLARVLAEAASPGGARLAPGASAPFLVAFTEYPPSLGGASLRVRTVAGEAR